MLSYLVLFIFAFLIGTLSVASYFDARTREVPDFISYLLIIGGLLLNLFLSISTGSASSLEFLPLSVTVLFGFSYLMYVSGQWAGGDVKLMLGLAMLFTAIDLSNPFSFANLFFNILIFGGLYGLVGTIIFGIIKFKELRKSLYFYDIGILIGGVAIILLILYLLPVPVNYLAASAIALLVLMRYIYVVAENLMFVNVSINKLTEGDWLAHDVVDDNGKTIVTKRNTGLVQEDIDKLRKSTVKSVLVKMGMPFVPGILIGTIITLFFGNPLLHLFLSNVFI